MLVWGLSEKSQRLKRENTCAGGDARTYYWKALEFNGSNGRNLHLVDNNDATFSAFGPNLPDLMPERCFLTRV